MQLGLGTAAIGRPQYINIREVSGSNTLNLDAFKQKGFNVLEQAYQLGIRYFDTAPGYGMAEQLLLEWLQTKDDGSIHVATKWGYTYVANFNPNATVHEIKEHSLKKLDEQWNTSKGLLPYLKVYQIHSATLETGVLINEAVLNRLAILKTNHHLKIGVTVTGDNQIEVLKKALDVSVEDKPLFDAFQITYNVLDQSLSELSTELIKQNKQIIIKEALANGRLFRNTNYSHYYKLYDALETLALKYNTTTDAILLNFCAQTIPNSTILSGASIEVHLKSNLKMMTLKLEEEDVEYLKSFRVETSKYWNERKQLSWN